MFRPFKRRNWTVVVSFIFVLSFVLMFAARGEAGCGKKGCSKECTHKTSEHGSTKHMKASTEGQEEDAPLVLTLDAFSTAKQYTCPMHLYRPGT